ncbi:hypothetical protein OSB04_019855 [Centaurea solstitialis]|uniref:Uncharacterized protein n=1 Tax=Centaurea solstitialis TaxID=347529 RepID=A0AA38W3A9_9ASTR|nr:hypothetical protein OSB04_019855 [Centaurea solstitialis]
MPNTVAELVFIPAPGVGHIMSTIEIAKLLVNRDQHLSVTVLVIKPPPSSGSGSAITAYIGSLANKSIDRIRFIELPQDENLPTRDPKAPMAFFNEFINSHCKYVRNAVANMTSQPGCGRVAGFVIDMFCTAMIDVANEFNVPTYVFFTSNAAFLGFKLYIQTLYDDQNQNVELNNPDATIPVPCFVNPVPKKVFPSVMQTKEGLDLAMELARKLRKPKAIMVNTFSELETHAVESLSSESSIPPVYTVGPLLNLEGGGGKPLDDDVMQWLDGQPASSVVFLCFGSMGSFEKVQVHEIAHALERSGHRFVWSLRRPPSKETTNWIPSDYEDPRVVLPEGFLERTSGIGKVIGWAPQVKLLGHQAVGGFVSHCGWNSMLESLWFGVPSATWPMYAEQQLNAFEMVVELGLAVEIKMDYNAKAEMVIVTADEIEGGIRRLMADDTIRTQVKEMSEKSRVAVMEGGSSYASVGHLYEHEPDHNYQGRALPTELIARRASPPSDMHMLLRTAAAALHWKNVYVMKHIFSSEFMNQKEMPNTVAELVFIPAPGAGHIMSTIEIAKLLVSRDQQLSVTVLVIKPPPSPGSSSAAVTTYIESLANKSIDRIRFIELPQDENLPTRDPKAPMTFFNEFIKSHCKYVRNAVADITSRPGSGQVAGFVIDMFCTAMIDVANEFNVPTYVFYTSNAAFLGFQMYILSFSDDQNRDVVESTNSDATIPVPSFVNPVPKKVFPSVLQTKEGLDVARDFARKMKKSKAIMVNTFSELETHAVKSLSFDSSIPPVYTVGPLLNLEGGAGKPLDDDVMRWLDGQPPSSVVFLCFGSMGSFEKVQVTEIAHALEQSGYHFVWSLRQPPSKETPTGNPSDYEDLRVVLPEGFLERTSEIGKVIGWAPQVALLAHRAVGGFVSHCGWNSMLESLWFGIPSATWPMYAEQQLNAFEMVVELGLAVEIKMDYKRDTRFNPEAEIVTADEIEGGIRRLMVDDTIRAKVKEMSEKSRAAVAEGGSSYASVGRLIQDFIRNIS